MGMCASGDILQSKVYRILGYIEVVKTYIVDIFVLSKERFFKYKEQLRIIFSGLRAEGFIVNAIKYSFGLKYITHLGYVIPR